jgi:hypothetical protein
MMTLFSSGRRDDATPDVPRLTIPVDDIRSGRVDLRR